MAQRQGAAHNIIPVQTQVERNKYDSIILQHFFNNYNVINKLIFDKFSKLWSAFVDGRSIFYKAPEHLRSAMTNAIKNKSKLCSPSRKRNIAGTQNPAALKIPQLQAIINEAIDSSSSSSSPSTEEETSNTEHNNDVESSLIQVFSKFGLNINNICCVTHENCLCCLGNKVEYLRSVMISKQIDKGIQSFPDTILLTLPVTSLQYTRAWHFMLLGYISHNSIVDIEQYIQEQLQKKTPVSLARFVAEKWQFIVENTAISEFGDLRGAWSSKFDSTAKRLEVTLCEHISQKSASPVPAKISSYATLHPTARQKSINQQPLLHLPYASKRDSFPLTRQAHAEFEQKFNSMDPEMKWVH
ncbi:hypothetical protein BDC45DRAFT_541144 [Circinella umbellata]|nr:hypothetical protein BDC45DRAFT_541144 [Circinella umbellata]